MMTLFLYQTQQQENPLAIVFALAFYVFICYCYYKLFQRAGIPNPWMAFIPILQFVPLLQLAKKPIWWIILLIIPLVNMVIMIILWLRISKAFGKSNLFGVGLALLGIIFIPILAFSDAAYNPNAISNDK